MNQRIEPNFGGTAPPPLPPRPQSPLPPPKRGMSGCMIVLIVCGVLAVPAIGILAAIAIPQYQRYVERSKAAQAQAQVSTPELRTRALRASLLAQSLRTEMEEVLANTGQCPREGDIDLDARGVQSDPDIASVTFGESGEGRCNLEFVLKGHPELDGRRLVWERNPVGGMAEWNCTSDLEAPYRPDACRAR